MDAMVTILRWYWIRHAATLFLGRRHKRQSSGEVIAGDWPHNVLIFRVLNPKRNSSIYRAFCAGNIITETRVLTSANCLLTNKKSQKHNKKSIRFVAGILKTLGNELNKGNEEEWRLMDHVYSQKYYRFPTNNLAIARMSEPWEFNGYVNKIPFATKDYDFDGVCTATAVKATGAWSTLRYLHTQEVEMLQRKKCEGILYRSCRVFICALLDNGIRYAFSETEGGGLVCFETGDPAEVDASQGVLVGVTTIINVGLPNLYMRVGMFHKWVSDTGCKISVNSFVTFVLIIVCIKSVIEFQYFGCLIKCSEALCDVCLEMKIV